MSSIARLVIDDQNPWPGLGAFDEAAQQFFNGRGNETAELRRLVLNASLTVLFGASGLGKTSLIQAGLFPSSRKEHFLPIYVRFNFSDKTGPLIEEVKFAFQQQVRAHGVDAPPFGERESLWEYLHRSELELWSPRNQLLTPLFVFDQFEEVFTLGAENAAATRRLRADLADLIENRVPDTVAKAVRADEAAAADLALDSQRYRVVLSFREDFLPAVESWKRDLPSILRNRLRLLPMSQERAFEAVHQTAPHLVNEALAHEIVQFVAAAREDGNGKARETIGDTAESAVEPALLSLMCHGLNEKRKAQGKAAFDEELLKRSKESIISEFYKEAVGDLPRRAQDFIGNELITERGFRKPCDVDDARTVHGVTDQQLQLLVNRRLLRIEPQRGTERVELTHDLLTQVVRADRDRRRKARRMRKLVVAFAGIALVLAGTGVEFKKRADKARYLAVATQQTRAKAQAQREIEEERRRHDAAEKRLQDRLKELRTAQQLTEAAKNTAEAKKDAANAEEARKEISVQLLASKAALKGTEGDAALPLSMLLAAESMRRQPFIDNQAILSKGLPLLPKPLGSLPNSTVNALTFTTDGLLVTSEPGFVRVWAPVSRKQLRQFPIPGRAGTIAVSSDGDLLAVAYDEHQQGIIQVYNLHTGELDSQRKTERGAWHIFVGRNGNLTAVIGNALYHWKDWSDEQGSLPKTLSSQDILAKGDALAVSSDQTLLAILDPDHSQISVHDFLTGDTKHSWAVGQVPVEDIVFDPSDTNHLASFDSNGTIKIWNVSRREVELNFQAGPIDGVQFSGDGRLLAANGSDGTVKIWDTRDGRGVASVLLKKGAATAVALDGANGIVALTQGDSTQLWQVGEMAPPDLSPIKKVLGVMASLHLAAGTCGDSQSLCVVRFGNGKAGELIQKFTERASLSGGLTFSGNGRFVAGGFRQYVRGGPRIATAVIWDIMTGERLSPEESAPLLGFTPESDGVILGKPSTKDKPSAVEIWDLRKKSFAPNVPVAFTRIPTSIAFSSDRQWLAALNSVAGESCEKTRILSSPADTTEQQRYCVTIWHWPDGKDIVKTLDVGARVRKMSFSSNGHFLITAAGEPFLRVWSVNTGKESGRVGLYRPGVPFAMEFEDGDRRIVDFDRYSVTNSPWRPEDLLKEVCERVGRSLTTEEWDEYLPAEKGKYIRTCGEYLPTP